MNNHFDQNSEISNVSNTKKDKTKIFIIVMTISIIVIIGVFVILTFAHKKADYWNTTVPNVIGSAYEKADQKLRNKQLRPLIKDRDDDAVSDEGFVTKQYPEGKRVVNKGSIVNLVLSSGKGKIFVPDVSGYEENYAESLLEEKGFNVKKSYTNEKSDYAPGSVIWTDSDPGTAKNKGDRLEIKIKKSSNTESDKTITVPDIIKMDYYAAKEMLRNLDLYIIITEARYSDEIPENQIISQNIFNTTVTAGSAISVEISLGKRKVEVPDITYKTQKSAEDILKSCGLAADPDFQESQTVAKGTVISQGTDPGTLLEEGSTVKITVSSGFEVEVPDVKGMQERNAIDEVVKSGLAVEVAYRSDSETQLGTVLDQSVSAGQKLQIGQTIVLYVNNGKETAVDNTTAAPEKKVLSPESAVKIYMDNEDVWAFKNDDFFERKEYTFIDIDFDGVLELVTAGFSGQYLTEKNYYKLDLTENSVVQIPEDHFATETDTFIIYKNKLLKSVDSGEMFYYDCNKEYIAGNIYSESFYEIKYINNKIVSANVFDEIYEYGKNIYVFYENVPKDMKEKFIGIDDDEALNKYYEDIEAYKKEVDKSSFDSIQEQYFKDNIDCNLHYECLNSDDIKNLDSEDRYNEFVKIYRAFSYDGFSFSNLSLYDIKNKEVTSKNGDKNTQAKTEKLLEATENDFNKLKEENIFTITSTLLKYNEQKQRNEIDYDYDSFNKKSASDKLFSYLYGSLGCILFYYEYYNEYPEDPEGYIVFNEEKNTDYIYYGYDINKVNWIINNILNIHTIKAEDLGNKKFYGYPGTYSKVSGNKLYFKGIVGDGDGYFPEIEKIERLSDGKYSLTISYKEFYTDEIMPNKGNAIVGLKEVDGKRIWSVYSYKAEFPIN